MTRNAACQDDRVIKHLVVTIQLILNRYRQTKTFSKPITAENAFYEQVTGDIIVTCRLFEKCDLKAFWNIKGWKPDFLTQFVHAQFDYFGLQAEFWIFDSSLHRQDGGQFVIFFNALTHCVNFFNACVNASMTHHCIADIVDGLHRDGDWNEAHEVVPVLQDRL